MLLWILWAAVIAASPVRDAETAIAIAAKACHSAPTAAERWDATLENGTWDVTHFQGKSTTCNFEHVRIRAADGQIPNVCVMCISRSPGTDQ